MVQTYPSIGFCGLGAMGGGMARNLAKMGFPVFGYDVYLPSVDKLVAVGGKHAKSPADAAANAEFLILMVVNDIQADEVLFGKDGAISTLGKDKTVILCSTTPPAYLPKLREHIDSVGRPDIKLLDCPVSGGSIRAAAGTLSIFSAGPEKDLDAAKVVLEAMADPLYRIPGGISMGSIAKMLHQHQAAVNIIMASEAMGLAAAAGLNTKVVYDTVCKSIGRSWMFENRGPHMLINDYLTVHSAVTIILKDAGIVTSHGKSQHFPLVLANLAEQLYITAVHDGIGKEDDAGLVRLFIPKDEPMLVGQLAEKSEAESVTVGKGGITVDDVINVMAGVELASTQECMAFAAHAGLDFELLLDILVRGAGASNMFSYAAPLMIKTNSMTFAPVGDAKEYTAKLKTSLDKAATFNQYMPMASAALQQLNMLL